MNADHRLRSRQKQTREEPIMQNSNNTAAKPLLTTRELTVTALMTAVMCVLGPISFPIPFSPVPISLGSLAVYLSAYVLGMKRGTLSVVIYLLLGLAGLPVFTGFSGGLSKVMGPTGGYMVGYVFVAVCAGLSADRGHGKKRYAAAGMIIGTFFLYLFGTLWLSRQLQITFFAGLGMGMVPYLPGDTAKIIIAVILGDAIRSALRSGHMLDAQ